MAPISRRKELTVAEYFVSGQRFVVSPEQWASRLPRETIPELESDLLGLAELEKCRDMGVMKCSDHDWAEIVAVAVKTAEELGFRRLFNECGIYMEVR